MPNDRRNGAYSDAPAKSWAERKQELFESIEELDRACANARQVIYRLRPLVRPKTSESTEADAERTNREQREVASYNDRRRRSRGR